MKDAKFQRVVDLTTNEEFINGGDVYLNGKLIGFDYISNIIKFETDQGTMYELYINRMFCQKLPDLDIEDLPVRPIKRISNSEKVFVEVVEEDENPAKKYLDNQKPKIYQAPLVETQNVNNVEELQNINNNNVAPQEPAQPVIEQSNNALDGDAGVGAVVEKNMI
uniref:Uncharacterized protein n=1 Tax=Panagrolaimus davidi TaxID=227884 RepID=A0A914PGZ4_9BILA